MAFDSHLVTRRQLLGGSLSMALALGLAGCGSSRPQDVPSDASSASVEEGVNVRVASLKGPTSIGIASFMDKAAKGETANNFEFTIAGSPDEVIPSIIKGEYDIALVPANAACVLYNKTEGGIRVIDINTLGVLSVVTGDASVSRFADLAGRTVCMTGKGANPEYAMNYLLEKNGLSGQVQLEFMSEATEVVSTLASDATAVGVLPQPFVTVATTKNPGLSAVIDLTQVWNDSVDDGSRLVQGVTVVSGSFLSEHEQAVKEFLEQHAASVDAANSDPAAVAPLVVSAGILDSEPVAQKAIPGCHLVCIEGPDMKDALAGYLQILFDADASSVGGSLPADDFYYGA